jgi:hypothetical protein
MSNPLPFRVRRFIVVAFCVTLAAAGLTFLVFLFPDGRPPTTFETICEWVDLVISWPLDVYSTFTPHNDPSLVVFILLCIASGLFWAFIFELFLMAKHRLWPHKPLDKIISK